MDSHSKGWRGRRQLGMSVPAAPGRGRGGEQHRWRILSAALLVQVIISLVTQAFPALVPFARADLQLSTPEIGLFATILNLGAMVALLPTGWAVDAMGERRVLVAGGIATGAMALVVAIAPTFGVMVPLLIVVGAAAATPTPAGSSAVIGAFGRRDRGFVMSVRQTGIPAGGALAALLLPPIAAGIGWRRALQVAALIAIAGSIVARRMLRGAPHHGSNSGVGFTSLRRVATRNATYVGLASAVLALGQFVLVSYIAIYLLDVFDVPVALGSLFLVSANLGGIVGRMLWGAASDRLFDGRRRDPLIVVSLCAAAGFLALAGLPATSPRIVMLTVVVLLGGTVIGWNGIYITVLSELAPADMRGIAVAYGMLLTQTGIVLGPFMFGLLVEISHSYRAAWIVVAGLMLVATGLLQRVDERGLAIPAAAVGGGVGD